MVRLLTFIAVGAMLWPSFGQKPAVSRHLANIVGPVDGRKPLVHHFPDFKLSALETEQIRNAVGYINCGNKHGWVTAFLVAPDVVATVAHVFYGVSGLPLAPRKQCFFRTQGDRPGVKYPIGELADDLVVGTVRPLRDRLLDWAVVRLQLPVEGAQPMRILHNPIRLGEWIEILPVSAYRAAEYRPANESVSEPLAQICHVRRVFSEESYRPSLFYSDCDNTEGGSGSPVLARQRDGQLAVVGMFEAGGLAEDRSEYSDTDGRPLSLALSLGIDGPFLTAIRQMKAASVVRQSDSRTQFILTR